jgi:GT2 family glycosyltransferase
MEKAAVIIVNYKDYAKKFLTECRDSLRQQTYPDFQVYIVDNASSEDTRSFLSESFPEAKIIPRLDGNYCAGNNAGIKQAMADGFELFVIANMDVKFDENWLAELVKAVKQEKVGIAQSKVLLYPQAEAEQKRPLINTLGNKIHFLGFGFTSHYRQPDSDVDNLVRDIDGYASGCSLIIKKEVLDRIGFYDEEYYMYHDDMEMGWRAKLAGFRIVLAPRSIIYHKYEFQRSVRMLYYMERNRFLAIFSYYQPLTICLLLPTIFAFELGMLFFSIIHGSLLLRLKIYFYFLRPLSWKHIKNARRAVAKFRIKKDAEIINDFAGRIEFQEINNWLLERLVNPVLDFYWRLIREIIRPH